VEADDPEVPQIQQQVGVVAVAKRAFGLACRTSGSRWRSTLIWSLPPMLAMIAMIAMIAGSAKAA
jgi:hypothetical protein